ncbi:hypothetical protein MRB53_039339 [Persea americana]|nr:hypothetical protein MRB53_039339 [Persea americana]
MTTNVQKFLKAVDDNAESFVQRLSKAVSIPSISADPSHRSDVFAMCKYLQDQMISLGIEVESRDNPLGKQHGTDMDLPPILLGTYGSDPAKKTILVYGHYDVQPASKEDGWGSEPFELTYDEKTGRMYGRGSSDDKGPVLGWLNAIEAYKKAGIDFPVNLKCCFEGMEEYGSEGLDELIIAEAKKYFKDVDAVCISDNYWLGSTKPCLTYGLRGVSYFNIVINGPGADLHSGVFVFSQLVDTKGHIKIPGIYDSVAKLTDKEKALYKDIEFTLEELQDATNSKTNIKDTIAETLMARWRYRMSPVELTDISLAINSRNRRSLFSSLPDMKPEEVSKLTTSFVQKIFEALGTKNSIKIEELHAGKPWYSSPDHWNFQAAAKATETVYVCHASEYALMKHVKPDLTREGGSIPVTLTFEESLGKNVCLLPMGQGNDGAHSINEKLDRRNYIEGTKLLGMYLYEIAQVQL